MAIAVEIIFCLIWIVLVKIIFRTKEELPINLNVAELGEEQECSDEPQSIVLKESKFNSSKIKEYQGESIKAFNWRPESFNQFIGQDEAKERAKTIIKKVNKNIKAHLFISSIQGHGKSTYIRLLAKTLKAKLIERVGKEVDTDELLNIINEINTCQEKYVIFFLDEIDSTDPKVIKVMNPIIEDFKIHNKRIKPFIFATASISKSSLIKTNPDFLDRISHHIHFSRYTIQDIFQILKQYKSNLYPNETIPDEIINKIAQNCKYNPRTSLTLLEDYIVEQDVNKVLKNNKIIKLGLTEIDIKILKILNEATRVMGANALSQKAGLSQNQYVREFEPYLCEFGFIERIPSRRITEKGKQLLKEVNYVNKKYENEY